MKLALEHEHELNIMRSRFIDVVSHEFRTPLTVLSASLSILKNYSDKLTSAQKNIQFTRMRDGITRLTELMEDVNALSRILEQQHELTITDILLQEFLSMLQYTLQETFPGRSLLLPNREAMNCVVSIDVELLRSVVYNILRNAFKYSPDTTNVVCNVWCTDSALEWEIIDNGYGIPEGEKQFIFDAFFRGSNCTHIPGVGIGLFLAKRALEGLYGTLEYGNNPNGGTIARCSIPVVAMRPLQKEEGYKL
jgi:K+-sensing histidine kinase KdpD